LSRPLAMSPNIRCRFRGSRSKGDTAGDVIKRGRGGRVALSN
jgi:hypothetical protein